MKLSLALFRYEAKFVGILLVILSIPCTYLYYWGARPDIFKIKVFAIVSKYMDTSYFVIAQTNILDELAAILCIVGIAIFSFSKDKKEERFYEKIRIKALISALYTTLAIWLLAILFTYGMAFIFVSLFIFIVFMITYNVYFRIYLIKSKKNGTKKQHLLA